MVSLIAVYRSFRLVTLQIKTPVRPRTASKSCPVSVSEQLARISSVSRRHGAACSTSGRHAHRGRGVRDQREDRADNDDPYPHPDPHHQRIEMRFE